MPVINVELPTLHIDQVAAYNIPGRKKLIRCGRRWGKTEFGITLAGDRCIKGKYVGWFAPTYKYLSEPYNALADRLDPVKLRSSKTEGLIQSIRKGQIDFWTLDDPRAGRGRKYHDIIIDEAAFTTPGDMMVAWEQAIQPTLLDFSGTAWVLSNTHGVADDNFLYQISPGGADKPANPGEPGPKYGFLEHHAPTMRNPHVPLRGANEGFDEYEIRRAETYAKLQRDNHPLVFQQEYLAEFVDWSGIAFFALDNLLVGGMPAPIVTPVDSVFAVIDTAVKTGKENDGTAVTFYATDRVHAHPLLILDWDIIQIEGDSLSEWLPTVFTRLEELAASCRARFGSLGVLIEDKVSGSVLLQHAHKRGWKAQALPESLVALGKDERALNVSSHVFSGKVKLTELAYNKVTSYKGVSRNHFISQVTGFRVGDKDAAKRADDLLDTFTYGVASALGNAKGF